MTRYRFLFSFTPRAEKNMLDFSKLHGWRNTGNCILTTVGVPMSDTRIKELVVLYTIWLYVVLEVKTTDGAVCNSTHRRIHQHDSKRLYEVRDTICNKRSIYLHHYL